MAPRALEPLTLTAEFWQREDVVAALDTCDIGALFRLMNRRAGASQGQIARAIGSVQPEVSKIMKDGPGQRRVTALDLLARIANGFDMPDAARGRLGLAPRATAAVPLRRSEGTASPRAMHFDSGARRPVELGMHDLQWSPRTDSAVNAAHGEDPNVNRRRFLQDVASVTLASMAAVEQIRQGLVVALDQDRNQDTWSEIVADYAGSFYLDPPDVLLRDLMTDVLLINEQMSSATSSAGRPLRRAAGQLAAITAMTCASLGQSRQALRWWTTARDASDRSGDPATRVWVRAWEVSNGLYERRPIRTVLSRADEARAIVGNRPDAGSAGLMAGVAQTLAFAGHPTAIDTLHEVADLTASMPTEIANDRDSMFGWPEVRLRHTESYVYTTLGYTVEAYAAQDAALALYGSDLLRERAAMLLHRAQCMIKDGDVSNGLTYAHSVLDQLPDEHHTELVYSIGRNVIRAVPNSDTQKPAVRALRERLALPSGSA